MLGLALWVGVGLGLGVMEEVMDRVHLGNRFRV